MNNATKEKWAAVFFGVFALLFLVLGVRNIGSTLDGPQQEKTAADAKLSYEIEEQFSATLDTDGDGLTDLEEISVYETSAYMVDSDSDGVSDGEEVDSGDNPLCPRGRTCTRGNLGVPFSQAPQGPDFSGGVTASGSDLSNIVAGSQDVSIEEIKQLLIDAGASEEEISKIPEEKLRKLYAETASTPEISEHQEFTNALLSQDPKKIRKMLKEQGVAPDVLDDVSDEELKEIFKQALEQGL